MLDLEEIVMPKRGKRFLSGTRGDSRWLRGSGLMGAYGSRVTEADAPVFFVREFVPADGPATLRVFLRAIRETASRDYFPEQIAAWGSDDIDPDRWTRGRREADTVVATSEELGLVGFSDLRDGGLLDMLFVSPDAGGRGVARLLVESVVARARERGLSTITTHASLTARPAFARCGFDVSEENQASIRGQLLTNFSMVREL